MQLATCAGNHPVWLAHRPDNPLGGQQRLRTENVYLNVPWSYFYFDVIHMFLWKNLERSSRPAAFQLCTHAHSYTCPCDVRALGQPRCKSACYDLQSLQSNCEGCSLRSLAADRRVLMRVFWHGPPGDMTTLTSLTGLNRKSGRVRAAGGF